MGVFKWFRWILVECFKIVIAIISKIYLFKVSSLSKKSQKKFVKVLQATKNSPITFMLLMLYFFLVVRNFWFINLLFSLSTAYSGWFLLISNLTVGSMITAFPFGNFHLSITIVLYLPVIWSLIWNTFQFFKCVF